MKTFVLMRTSYCSDDLTDPIFVGDYASCLTKAAEVRSASGGAVTIWNDTGTLDVKFRTVESGRSTRLYVVEVECDLAVAA